MNYYTGKIEYNQFYAILHDNEHTKKVEVSEEVFLTMFGSKKTEIVNNIKHYYITYKTDGISYIKKVDKLFYESFQSFKSLDKKEQNFYERHVEQSQFELSEELLNKQFAGKFNTIEEIIQTKMLFEEMYSAINELPRQQKRRFVAHYINEMTYKKIAEQEGCTEKAVRFSVNSAREKVSKKLKKYIN